MSKFSVNYQNIFAQNVAKLILYATQSGYQVTLGEAWRTQKQQDYYYKMGLTKAKVSQHQKRLAIDINLFRDGVYLTETEDYAFIGDYWTKLHPFNRWGGHFSKLRDGNHFELKEP